MKFTNHHISDLIVRLRNSLLRKNKLCIVPNIRLLKNILVILQQEGFISGFAEKNHSIEVKLKYKEELFAIRDMSVVSKPSKRVYKKYSDISHYYNGLGVVIISTSKGIMTNFDAVKNKLGGEVLCQFF